MNPAAFVTRFAPSPTGRLHRGHAFSALTAYAAAQSRDGEFLLRIEDIDPQRCRPEWEAAIFEDLEWLGLTWPTPVRRQSDHLRHYREALASLRDRSLLYRCFRSRAQLADDIGRAPHGVVAPSTGGPLSAADEAENLRRGLPFAWRLSIAAAHRELGGFGALDFLEEGVGRLTARPELWGDVVLARKDAPVAYHLAVVVDDAAQGVTHVIRGEDLRAATHIHRMLQALLGLPTPVYRHHPLLLRPDGRRLAKRDTTETLADLRRRGVPAETLRRELLQPPGRLVQKR